MSFKWLLPPIVGEVTMDYAVMILEVESDCELTLQLNIFNPEFENYNELLEDMKNYTKSSFGSCLGYTYKKPLDNISFMVDIFTNNLVKAGAPEKFTLGFPKPGIYYVQWFDDNGFLRYKHIINNTEPKKWVFLSCDFVYGDSKKSLWEDLVNETSENTAIFHLGDQIYADKEFNKALKYFHKNIKMKDQEIFNNTIAEFFRKRYRKTFSMRIRVLSNCRNYYILDDHEIKNNLTFYENIGEDERYIAKIAKSVYSEYQENQQQNITYLNDQSGSWIKKIDPFTTVIAIERTDEEINIDNIITKIENNLETRRLVLCFSAPIVSAPEGRYGRIYKAVSGSGKFLRKQEIEKLYQFLLDFKNKNRYNQVILVGGDLHCGSYGIVKNDFVEFPVIIASPITNNPTWDRSLISKGLKQGITFENGMLYENINSKAKRCYAKVNPEDFSCTMIYNNYITPKSVTKYFSELWKMK